MSGPDLLNEDRKYIHKIAESFRLHTLPVSQCGHLISCASVLFGANAVLDFECPGQAGREMRASYRCTRIHLQVRTLEHSKGGTGLPGLCWCKMPGQEAKRPREPAGATPQLSLSYEASDL